MPVPFEEPGQKPDVIPFLLTRMVSKRVHGYLIGAPYWFVLFSQNPSQKRAPVLFMLVTRTLSHCVFTEERTRTVDELQTENGLLNRLFPNLIFGTVRFFP